MKKLGKLSINFNKVIKNEELVNLKGGGYDNILYCCWDPDCLFYCSYNLMVSCGSIFHDDFCSFNCPDYIGMWECAPA